MIYAMAALVLLQMAGEILARWWGVPVPGPLLGMALMLIALCLLQRLPVPLGRLSSRLLAHLMLLFMPSVVAIMTQVDRISLEWLPFVAACVGATAVTTVVTAATLKYMLKRQQHK